jgi:hypothetical protein
VGFFRFTKPFLPLLLLPFFWRQLQRGRRENVRGQEDDDDEAEEAEEEEEEVQKTNRSRWSQVVKSG